MELPGIVVHSMYKPPPEPFRLHTLGQRNKPHIVIVEFNSHSTLWGYTTTNSDGESVEQWADSNSLSLIHNAKLPKSFNSAIWKNGYNPDLIFVSSNISDMCEKSVLDRIPRTQHHPICDTVNPVIVPQPTTSRRRFNLKKANNSRLQVVEPPRGRCFIWQIGVNSSIQDRRQVNQVFFMESSKLYAATLTHYSTEPLTTGPNYDPLLLLLALAGDVHPNPGPSRYPCSVCFKNVTSQGTNYLCTRCSHWVDSRCSGLRNAADYRKANGWICTACMTPPRPRASTPPPSPTHTPTMSDKAFNMLQWNANGIGNKQTELSIFPEVHNVKHPELHPSTT